MPESDMFFPTLARRKEYSTKLDGSYYEYSHYKQEIRQDSLGRCVYCDTHEDEIGGQETMELDHFRPRKYPQHHHLVNDPTNLVWSCRGCNNLKRDHWPALGTGSSIRGNEGFVDPFNDDRADFFRVESDGELIALKPPAQYMIMILVLNRVSRRRLREKRIIMQELIQEIDRQAQLLKDTLTTELSKHQRGNLEEALKANGGMRDIVLQHFPDFSLR